MSNQRSVCWKHKKNYIETPKPKVLKKFGQSHTLGKQKTKLIQSKRLGISYQKTSSVQNKDGRWMVIFEKLTCPQITRDLKEGNKLTAKEKRQQARLMRLFQKDHKKNTILYPKETKKIRPSIHTWNFNKNKIQTFGDYDDDFFLNSEEHNFPLPESEEEELEERDDPYWSLDAIRERVRQAKEEKKLNERRRN